MNKSIEGCFHHFIVFNILLSYSTVFLFKQSLITMAGKIIVLKSNQFKKNVYGCS